MCVVGGGVVLDPCFVVSYFLLSSHLAEVALLCVVDVCVLCLFFTIPCVVLQSVIVLFPG